MKNNFFNAQFIKNSVVNLVWLLYFLTYFSLVIFLIIEEPKVLDLISDITALLGGIAALVAAYAALSGIHTWQSQVKAPLQYMLIVDSKRKTLALYDALVQMLDTVFYGGFDHPSVQKYLNYAGGYIDLDTKLKECQKLHIELKTNFPPDIINIKKYEILFNLLSNLEKKASVNLQKVNSQKPDMVYTPIRENDEHLENDPTYQTQFNNELNTHFRSKERLLGVKNRIFSMLDEIETEIR